MATYKVIQDVEAEDKILGPLSLKQLIYAAIGFAIVFIAFRIVTATGVIYTAIPFVPFVIVFFALAAPFSRDQTTELWLAAMIRFYTKPRKRLWDQDGLKDLVTITAPKKIEKHYTDGLNQNQVRSRLSALANTMDTRGWAVKNVNTNMNQDQSGYSDRLLDPSSLPAIEVGNLNEAQKATDILDVNSSTIAQNFDTMMKQKSQQHHQEILSKMQQSQKATPVQAPTQSPTTTIDGQTNTSIVATEEDPELQPDYWFTKESYEDLAPGDNKKSYHKTSKPKKQHKTNNKKQHSSTEPETDNNPDQLMFNETLVAPSNDEPQANNTDLTEEEIATLENIKKQKNVGNEPNHNHHKMVLTPSQLEQQAKELAAKEQVEFEKQQKQKEAKTHLTKTDTIEFAHAKDLKVSTVAGLAKHKTEKKKDPSEVVINLH